MIDMTIVHIEAEARRYCDRHEIRDYDSFQRIAASMRHQAFLQAIEPLNKMKARWLSLCAIPGGIVIHKDGSFESRPIELPPEVRKAFAELDELIIAEAQWWGFDRSPIPERTGG